MNRRQFSSASLAYLASPGIGRFTAEWRRQRQRNVCVDWPQWGGIHRNFQVPKADDGVASPRGMEKNWERPLGQGHSAVVCDQKFGYSMHLDQGDERVQQWDLQSGHVTWQYRYPVNYHATYSEYDGPHSTPLIAENTVFTVSIDAQVHAIQIADGQLVWWRDLRADAGTVLRQSGYAASPVRWRNRLILPALGDGAPGAIALDLNTGTTQWESTDFESSHSSPIIVIFMGQPMVVFHGMNDLVALDPTSGALLCKHSLRSNAADNVTFTPIWDPKHQQFLVSHGYCNRGTQAIGIRKEGKQWKTALNWSNRQLQIVHTNAVLVDQWLIGTNRTPTTLMVAIDVGSGETVFRSRGFGKSNLIAQGRDLYILDERGDFVRCSFDRSGPKELYRERVLTPKAWTVPTIVGRTVLMRDFEALKSYRLTG